MTHQFLLLALALLLLLLLLLLPLASCCRPLVALLC
jgi:hypothetical protein